MNGQPMSLEMIYHDCKQIKSKPKPLFMRSHRAPACLAFALCLHNSIVICAKGPGKLGVKDALYSALCLLDSAFFSVTTAAASALLSSPYPARAAFSSFVSPSFAFSEHLTFRLQLMELFFEMLVQLLLQGQF